MSAPIYTVVIPVYNSAEIVGETIDRTMAFFQRRGWSCEIIAVNDGSDDGSWDVLRGKAAGGAPVVAIDLLRNYGQHTALFCGLQQSRGRYVITMDDDLQNPPEDIQSLVEKAAEGHDAVFGRFRETRHAPLRRVGSRLVLALDRWLFGRPKNLVTSNFRLIRRDVVDRVCASRTPSPYVRGLILECSASPANAWVTHAPRARGTSGYTPRKLASFVARILFAHSPVPFRAVGVVGILLSALTLLIALALGAPALTGAASPQASLLLLAALGLLGTTIVLMLVLLGEHVLRLTHLASAPAFHIREIVPAEQPVVTAKSDC